MVHQATPKFVGREFEWNRLREISDAGEAALVIVHGRRRVGKTTLIERIYGERSLIKLEGLEGQSPEAQQLSVLEQLAVQTNSLSLRHVRPSSWREVLRILTEHIKEGEATLFLEEFQWLASYETELISEIKFFWDNYWRHNRHLIVVICGSSPSFIVGQVVRSKSLYNRSLHEVPLAPLSLAEVRQFVGEDVSSLDTLDALLLVGGIPEYLRYLRKDSSFYLSLADNSFTPGAFFVGEYERIFVSALANNPHYRRIIEFLAARRSASRKEIANYLGITSGSNLSRVLDDLEQGHFIGHITPYDKGATSSLSRYEIADPYLQFYVNFIKPRLKDIANGKFKENPLAALPFRQLEQWLGYGFERFCRHNSHLIAKVLGFAAVEYTSGPYFNRATSKADPGFQLDLLFNRADRVLTVCEVKHNLAPLTKPAAIDIVARFDHLTLPKRYRLQRVLISTGGVTPDVRDGPYFDRIVGVGELVG